MKINFLQKIFGKKQPHSKAAEPDSYSLMVVQIQEKTNRLWPMLKETVDYYKAVACPCAFPRFIQYTSIDCTGTSNSFYMSETEGFIQASGNCFNVKEIDKSDECYRAIYTCKTCGSTYMNAWSDFSIRVSRTYLKPLEIKAKQIGADPEQPIPFFVGLFGHSLPERSGYREVDFESFVEYLRKSAD